MKKTLFIVLLILSALCFFACAAPATPATPVATPTPQVEATATPQQFVTFTDPVLEEKIRAAMNKPTGDISIADAEGVTELILNMDGGDWTPPRIASLKDIAQFPNLVRLELNWALSSGEESFDISPLAGLTKLERLFVCCDNIADVSALSGMTNMRELWIWGNGQITDISALAGMTQMGDLWIKGNQISDISALSGMQNLGRLLMEDNKVTDISALADLHYLTILRLSGNPIADYSPLEDIYPYLTEKDFAMATSLRDLGFTPIDNAPQVESYKTSELIIQVHHQEWGEQSNPDEVNAVILYKNHGTDQELRVIYYPDQKLFLVLSQKENFRYTYDIKTEKLNIEYGEEAAKAFLLAAYPEAAADPMQAPINDFNTILQNTFGYNANALYLLPREAPTVDPNSLLGLGFRPRKDLGAYLYEQQGSQYYDIEVRNPAWSSDSWQEGGDVRFFMPISDEYRIVITYYVNGMKYHVKADDNDQGGADFYYFANSDRHEDAWCSREGVSVEEYFTAAFNNPDIQDVYAYAVSLMTDFTSNTFGKTPEELYALPTGE